MRKWMYRGWAVLIAVLVSGALVAVQAQTTKAVTGQATVTSKEVSGEVVQVEGNDLVVKLSSGEIRTFRVPQSRKFEIDGTEVGVGDLKPGTTLTATVTTKSTPIAVRTKTSVSGRVWFVMAPSTVILTLPDGQNKQYFIRDEDKIEFTVEGAPATVFDLRKGMIVSASKIVEEPDVEITTDTKVVGQAPKPTEAPAPAAQAPATPPAAPAQAAEPAAQGGSRTWLWVVLILVLAVIVYFAFRKSGEK